MEELKDVELIKYIYHLFSTINYYLPKPVVPDIRVLKNNRWVKIEMSEIEAGDKFKILTGFSHAPPNRIFTAVSKPTQNEDKTWSINTKPSLWWDLKNKIKKILG